MPETPMWKRELARDLKEIIDRYPADRHPATPETQRAYGQDLEHLEESYQDRIGKVEREQQLGFDNDYRKERLRELAEKERTVGAYARDDNTLWDNRRGQKTEREDLAEGKRDAAYRQTQEYRDGMQAVIDEQVRQREKMDQVFRDVEDGLNDRFGFTREQQRERRNDRER